LGQVFYYYFKALFLGWGRVGWGGDFFPFFSMAWEKLFGWLKIFFLKECFVKLSWVGLNEVVWGQESVFLILKSFFL